MNSVVIIEDDPLQQEMLETIVAEELGFKAYIYRCAEDFFNSDIKHSHCTYLIDWNLPGIQGPDIVRTIRKKDEVSSIFMISANFTSESIVEGISAGADVYLVKPYSPELLVKNIVRAHNRFNAIKEQLLNYGIKLFEESGMVIRNGTPVYLTGREFQVFKNLFSDPLKVWKREELISLSSETDAIGRKIDVIISSIRKKVILIDLEINTIRGEGYKLIGL